MMLDVKKRSAFPVLAIMKAVPPPAEDEFAPLRPQQILGGRYFWALLLYSILLLWVTGTIAARRHLWWDEIDVYYIAAQPFDVIFRSLSSGLDWQSPTYYIPLHYLVKWFGASSFVLRSISVFPYWLATLVVYFAVARRTAPIYGFLAMLFLSMTLAFAYSFEARPYGLVLLFSACAFLSWQLTQETRVRRFALPALTISLAAGFAVHYNACLVALPLLAGEAILAVRRRAYDLPVLLSICCGAFPILFLFPNILAHQHYGVIPSNASLIGRVGATYEALFYTPSLLSFGILGALGVWLALLRKDGRDQRVLVSDFESLPLAVGGTFLLIPIAFCAVSHFTQTYYPRYVLETVIGAAIFLAFAVHGVRRIMPHLASVLVVISLAAVLIIGWKRLRSPDEYAWGTFASYAELFDRSTTPIYDSRDPLLLGQGAYLIALRYADEDLRDRAFHLLSEPGSNATPFALSDRQTYKALERLDPRIHVPDYDSFKRAHSRFLMYDPDQWVLDRLIGEGAEIKIQATMQHGPLYEVVLKSNVGRL